MAAQQLAGEVVNEAQTDAKARIPVEILNLQWVWCHFPLAWEFKDGMFLPELAQVSFRKGLNGQPEDGAFSAHKQHVTKKGGNLIEPTNQRLGKYKNYLRKFAAYSSTSRATGFYFCSMFETPTLLGGRTVKWTFDGKGFDEFRRYLLDKGIVESIDASIVASKIEEAENFRDHLKSLPRTHLRDENIDKLDDKIEAMRAYLEKMDSTEAVPEAAIEVEPDEASDKASDNGENTPRRKPGTK